MLTKNSSVVTNDIQGLQKYPHHRKQLQERTSMRKHGTKTTPVFLPANGEAFVATSKFGLLMIRSDSATRKDLFIVGTPPPLLFKGGQDLPKTESLEGLPKILLKMGVWCRNGGLPLFLLLYSSTAFTVYVGRYQSKMFLNIENILLS